MIVFQERIRTNRETLQWIRPLAEKIGITRIADVTWLDQIGLPVFQAIRPLSRNYIVSQGKGLSKEQAEISAIMESIEMFHAEDIKVAKKDTINTLESFISYNTDELEIQTGYTLNKEIVIDWASATNMITNQLEWVPKDLICLDFTLKKELPKIPFRVTSNGLASGNCKAEALLHGLLEVIERECLTNSKRYKVDLVGIPESTTKLIESIKKAGNSTEIYFLENKYNLPCFEVFIRQSGKLVSFKGTACHNEKKTALIKAFTEAVQSRLTFITGSRDDILEKNYSKYKTTFEENSIKKAFRQQEPIFFNEINEAVLPSSIEARVKFLANLVHSKTNTYPLYVNLTKDEFRIPVYFVIVPKLMFRVRH